MWVLWIKKILFNIFAWTIFWFLILIIVLFILWFTSPRLHTTLIQTFHIPKFIVNLDTSLRMNTQSSNPEVNWIFWDISVKNLEGSNNIIDLYEETEYIRNCKVIDNFSSDDLTSLQVSCGLWSSRETMTIKFMWLHFPKKWECWFSEVQTYLKKILSKKYIKLQIYGERKNIKYAYLFLWTLNINNDLLKRWYAFYIEHWLKDLQLYESFNKSYTWLEWLFQICNIENPLSRNWEQILTPN